MASSTKILSSMLYSATWVGTMSKIASGPITRSTSTENNQPTDNMKAILLPALALAILATMPACSTTTQPTYAGITPGTVLKQNSRIHAGYYVSPSGRIIPFCLPDWGWPVHLNIRRYTHDWDHHTSPTSCRKNHLTSLHDWRRSCDPHHLYLWIPCHQESHQLKCTWTPYSYSWSWSFSSSKDNICHSSLPSSL